MIKVRAIGGGHFFLNWQIAQQFAVQDQAQGTNGFPLNPILNTLVNSSVFIILVVKQ